MNSQTLPHHCAPGLEPAPAAPAKEAAPGVSVLEGYWGRRDTIAKARLFSSIVRTMVASVLIQGITEFRMEE